MILKCRKHDCWPEWEPGGREQAKPEEFIESEADTPWGGIRTYFYWVKPKGFYCPLCRLEMLAEANQEEVSKWNQQQEPHGAKTGD